MPPGDLAEMAAGAGDLQFYVGLVCVPSISRGQVAPRPCLPGTLLTALSPLSGFIIGELNL